MPAQTLIPRFETIGVNDGLPHSSVYSILQDKKGFMWFGTADGLSRYDGNALVTYKYSSKDQYEPVNNFVKGKMLEDKEGNIWYCNENGIFKWSALNEAVEKVRSFSKKELLGTDFLAAYIDSTETIWMWNIIFGMCAFNISTRKFTRYPITYPINYGSAGMNYVNVDDKGNIYLKHGASADAFAVFNITTHRYTVSFKNDPPQAVFFNNNKRILAYDHKLVYSNVRPGVDTTINKTLDGKPISFYSFDGKLDNYGRVWMTARGNGLFYYDEANKKFTSFRHDNSKIKSLPFNLTTCLFIDRNENLWIGIDGGGVAKLDLKAPRFNLFPLSEGDYPVLNDYFTKCFYQDDKGRIWFGSHTNGLSIYDPSTLSLKNFQHDNKKQHSLPGNSVGSILKDRAGNMWIGSSGGIALFNEETGSFKNIPIKNLPPLFPTLNNFIYKIRELANGEFLLATLLGLVKIKKTGKGYQGFFYPNNGYISSSITDVIEMPDKTIYTTSPGLGIYHLRPAGEMYKIINILFIGIDLRSLRIDEKNKDYLWISSGIGLIHFNTINNKYQVFNEKHGLANSYVYGSLEDDSGNLWISTNKGLSFLNRKENKFLNFSFQDGLQSNEFNTQAFYKSNTGVFYFGGIKGFNWFNSNNANKEIVKPSAAITNIEIHGKVYKKDSAFLTDQKINVPHYENDLNFKFAALDFTRPEANNIQYMLQGWDAGWINADNNSARYSNLTPGKYILKVKASNAAGVWSKEEKIFINIKYPFWERPWFVVLLSLFLLGVIIFLTYTLSQIKAKRKFRLLEKQIAVDAERNRISLDMHDEIGSGITHIALLSELIQTQHKEEKELKKDIHSIGTSARKLVQTMSEIIWALNPENDTLESLLTYIREQSQQYFEALDVHFEVEYPIEIPDIKMSNAERRNLYLVTREALNNAMKHGGGKQIKLSLEITEKEYCFNVTDNGSGIKSTVTKSGHNGLHNMKKRMEDIGGTIEWINNQTGTTVRFCLPA